MRLIAFLIIFTHPTFSVEAELLQDWQLPVKNKQFDQDSCVHPDLHSSAFATSRLRKSLKREFIGQHIAQDLIHFSISAHLEDPAPSKPLVLSLHGFPDAEKRLISKTIAESIYFRGVASKYFLIFEFEKIKGLKAYLYRIGEMLLQLIVETPPELEVEKGCSRFLLIFDVDKYPSEIQAGLAKARSLIAKPDYNKHIFIFFTSVGVKEIRDISYAHWKNGKERENLDYKHFHKMLKHVTYNISKSSWFDDTSLIDWHVPFLPLERQLIISCIQMEARKIGMTEAEIEEEAEKIADMVYYWPVDEKVFATTSCKKVESLVRLRHSKTTSQKSENCGGGGDDNPGTYSKENRTEEEGQ